jgi:hypothetical protein
MSGLKSHEIKPLIWIAFTASPTIVGVFWWHHGCQVIVLHSWFLPALCQKARIAMLMQDWDLVQETAHVILQKVCLCLSC